MKSKDRKSSILKPCYLLKSWPIFDKATKLCKTRKPINWGRWFIYLDLLNELVAKGVTYEVHEYTPMFPLRSGTPDLTDLTAAASSGSTAHNQ